MNTINRTLFFGKYANAMGLVISNDALLFVSPHIFIILARTWTVLES